MLFSVPRGEEDLRQHNGYTSLVKEQGITSVIRKQISRQIEDLDHKKPGLIISGKPGRSAMLKFAKK